MRVGTCWIRSLSSCAADARAPMWARGPLPALTLIEVLVVMLLLGIAAGLALPSLGDTRQLRLREAARILAADIELAQNESIAHADDPRLLKMDMPANRYWVAPASAPDAPINDPASGRPLRTVLGIGRASGASGIAIQSFNLGGDSILRFDGYGCPDQDTEANVVLTNGSGTLAVRVSPGSGEVSIGS